MSWGCRRRAPPPLRRRRLGARGHRSPRSTARSGAWRAEVLLSFLAGGGMDWAAAFGSPSWSAVATDPGPTMLSFAGPSSSATDAEVRLQDFTVGRMEAEATVASITHGWGQAIARHADAQVQQCWGITSGRGYRGVRHGDGAGARAGIAMTGAGAGGGTRITGVEPRWWWTPSLVSYRVVEIEIVGVHNSQWRTVLLSLHPPALPPCYINARRFCLSLSLRRLPPPHPSPLLGAAPRRAASSASPPRSPTTRPAPTSSRCSQSPPATPPLTPRIPDAESCPSPAAVSSVFSKFRDPAPSPVTPDDAAAAPDEPRDLGFDDDDSFDADSILCGVHQSAAEGIDGIMGSEYHHQSSAEAA
uniref:Uncharacterized protein n=1 Tax=Zea mays TaxID=4577 RepID=A0A804LMK7_MAIZE